MTIRSTCQYPSPVTTREEKVVAIIKVVGTITTIDLMGEVVIETIVVIEEDNTDSPVSVIHRYFRK